MQAWGGELAFPLPATNSTPYSWIQDRSQTLPNNEVFLAFDFNVDFECEYIHFMEVGDLVTPGLQYAIWGSSTEVPKGYEEHQIH